MTICVRVGPTTAGTNTASRLLEMKRPKRAKMQYPPRTEHVDRLAGLET